METKENLAPRIARDIAWAVASPPLLIPEDDSRFPSQSWFSEQFSLLKPTLAEFADNPAAVSKLENTCDGLRLGGYFEQLILWWLKHSPNYEVLAHNLQVNGDGRTQGAFDLIVRDLSDDVIEHWELACKFYIQDGAGEALADWYGPARNDVFIKKYRHLLDHQIALSQTKFGQQTLAAHGWEVDRHKIIVKGRLFGDFNSDLQLPSECNPLLLRGWLKSTDETSTHSAEHLALQRQYWMSDIVAADIADSDPATAYRHGSVCVAEIEQGCETSRGFIVPDGWFTTT